MALNKENNRQIVCVWGEGCIYYIAVTKCFYDVIKICYFYVMGTTFSIPTRGNSV